MALFDAFPGEKLAMKIWDTLEKGGIGLLRPGQLRREGKAKAQVEYLQRIAIVQAEKDAADLAAGRSRLELTSGKVLPNLAISHTQRPQEIETTSHPRLGSAYGPTESALQGLVLRETRRAINIEKTIEKAQVEAAEVLDDTVSDADVDPDWLTRWHAGAQDVTDEDVKLLWARALAGEVRSPGRYALRTLEFLRSVSKSEAELIEMIGPLSFGAFIFNHEKSLDRLNINLGVLSELQNLGVLGGVEAVGIVWNVPLSAQGSSEHGYVCNDLGVRLSDVRKEIQIPCYTITSLGRELLSLGQFRADREYMVTFAKFVASHGIKVALGNAIPQGEREFVLAPPFDNFEPPSSA